MLLKLHKTKIFLFFSQIKTHHPLKKSKSSLLKQFLRKLEDEEN